MLVVCCASSAPVAACFLGALYRLGRIMAFYLSVVSPRACVLPHYLLYKQTCIGTCMSAYLFKDTV